MYDSLWPHGPQGSLSITNSQSLLKLMSIESVMPSNHLILCRPLFLLPQSFPASGSFPMNRFFTSGHQSIAALASASVLPMNIQDWFSLRGTAWISLLFKRLSRVFSNQFSLVTRSCPTLYNPMSCSTPGLPVPTPTPRAYPNSCPLNRWCHPTISSSVIPFSSCPQSFPATGSFKMSQLFTSGGHGIGASASASVLPVNMQGWFSLGLTGLISLMSKGLSRVFSSTTIQKASIWCSAFFMVQLSHPYMTTGKTIALTRQTFAGKVTSLLFNMLSSEVCPEKAVAPQSSTLAWKIP